MVMFEGTFRNVKHQSCVDQVLLQIENVIVDLNAAAVEIDDVGREAEIVKLFVDDAVVREELALENEKLRKNLLMRWELMDFQLIRVRKLF
jgi:hypothetical protein